MKITGLAIGGGYQKYRGRKMRENKEGDAKEQRIHENVRLKHIILCPESEARKAMANLGLSRAT